MSKIIIIFVIIIVIVIIIVLIAKTMQLKRYRKLIKYSNDPKHTQKVLSAYADLPDAAEERTVISMTSIPERLNYLRPVLNSLLDQTYKVDEISLNIPHVSRKGTSYEIPKWLEDLAKNMESPIQIHRVPVDLGPGTKILPTLKRETLDTIVIVVDDDNIYSSKLVEGLIEEFEKYDKKCAITNYGMVMKKGNGFKDGNLKSEVGQRPVGDLKFPFKYDRALSVVSASREADFVQGCTGFLVTPGMFPKQVFDLKSGPKEALTVDDIWISGWLHYNGIKIMQPKMNIRYVPLPHVSALRNTPSLIWTENSDRKNDLATIEWFRKNHDMKLLCEKG